MGPCLVKRERHLSPNQKKSIGARSDQSLEVGSREKKKKPVWKRRHNTKRNISPHLGGDPSCLIGEETTARQGLATLTGSGLGTMRMSCELESKYNSEGAHLSWDKQTPYTASKMGATRAFSIL